MSGESADASDRSGSSRDSDAVLVRFEAADLLCDLSANREILIKETRQGAHVTSEGKRNEYMQDLQTQPRP